MKPARAPAGAVKPRCEPPQAHWWREFHWLVRATPGAWFSGDLWRWQRGVWRCARTPEASFSAEELHAQGWVYAEPCVPPAYRLVPRA